jgi:hypothetical protein
MTKAEILKRGYEEIWENATAEKRDGMMAMLLELRAGLEERLARFTVPSADRDEAMVGFADVEAMILQAGGDPARPVN